MPGRKDRKAPIQLLLSPEKYICTKARQLPVFKCFISENWEESGGANIIVSRRQPSGNIVVGGYYVDLFCCGLKDSFYVFNMPEFEFDELVKDEDAEVDMIDCSYELAHNIIYGAIAYAEDLGLKPHKDWAVSQYILEDDTDNVELIEIQFGRKNGRPMLITTPEAPMSHVIRTLDKTIGRDAYDIIQGIDWLENDEEDYEGEEDAEDFNPDEERHVMDLLFSEIVDNFWKLFDSPGKRADRLDTVDHIRINDYELTEDPLKADLYNITKEEIKLLQDLFNIVLEEPEAAVERLMPMVEQYPHNPVMHNYLLKACLEAGREEQATQLILEGYEKFPDYLMARCNYAHYLLSEKRTEEVPAVFGGVFDLKLLYPERDSFHVSEFENFYDVIARYYIINGRIRNAEHLLGQISSIAPDSGDSPFYSVQRQLWQTKLRIMFDDQPLSDKLTIPEWKPVYKHKIIKRLDKKGVEIDVSILKTILALPPEEWIADLKQGVFDAFIKIFSDEKLISSNECPEIVSHAFFLIGECGKPEELDYLLAILGQDYDILESLFGDMLTEKAWMPVYRLGMDRLETLYEFCISENEAFSKCPATQAFVQMALQAPEKKEKVTEIFKRISAHYLNLKECSEDDEEFIKYMAADIVDLKDPSFIPVLKIMDERKFIDNEMLGSLEVIIEHISDTSYKPLIWPVQDIFEIYRDVLSWK